MKNFLVLSFFFALSANAQQYQIDSLSGFDLTGTVIRAHQLNLTTDELKNFVEKNKRDFIGTKYSLNRTVVSETSYKYNSGAVNGIPCVNENFELFPLGPITSAFGWTTTQVNYSVTQLCSLTPVPMSPNVNVVAVYSTPLPDGIMGTVKNSPLGGTKIAKINSSVIGTGGRIRQIFPVTASN